MKLAEGISADEVAAQFRVWIEGTESPEEEALEPYLIRHSLSPVKPDRILSIGFQSVASAGGVVCITGGSGTGKSNYAAAILSGTLHTVLGNCIDTLGIRVSPNVERKAVLLLDTEQSQISLTRIWNVFLRVPESLSSRTICK